MNMFFICLDVLIMGDVFRGWIPSPANLSVPNFCLAFEAIAASIEALNWDGTGEQWMNGRLYVIDVIDRCEYGAMVLGMLHVFL